MPGNRFYRYFLIIVGAGLFLYLVAIRGWYPVAIVNSQWIMAYSLQKQSLALLNFYAADSEIQEWRHEAEEELYRLMLNRLIENVLIDEALRQKSDKSLEDLVTNKLASLEASVKSTGDLMADFYGLDRNDFSSLILRPQARREVLSDDLLASGTNIDKWLAEAKTNSSVIILTPKLRWNGQGVELNK